MIHLSTNTPFLRSELNDIVRLFWPDAVISLTEGERMLTHVHEDMQTVFRETWTMDGRTITHEAEAIRGGLREKRQLKRAVKTGLFLLMTALTGSRPPWGSLTGIRPTRLLYEAIDSGMTPEQGADWLQSEFFVAPDRARLLHDIIAMQRGLIERDASEYDVYIGIPFCVTRCAYCSFSSGTLGDGRLVEPYLDALEREMAGCADFLRPLGLKVRAVYMGGGTPTALSADQLARVIDRAQAHFPGAREWTVEAGRPDTIDREKLAALKARGVGRISINPQTFSDETLRRVGRAHTAHDTLTAFHLARSMGFDNINMDVIAALPGEDEAAFDRTLSQVIALDSENVTVHSLAIKRSSALNEEGYQQDADAAAQQMVDRARQTLTGAGYRPYYLYRQKHMAGNLENVGYAKPGRACLYNIDNMEETCPVLALGAGAITKWLFPRERRIERAPNVKNIEAYIARVDEMIARKRDLIR